VRLSKKLTKIQTEILDKMPKGKELSAYDLQCSLATLNALYHKGYVSRTSRSGSMFCPRTGITFQKV
jgi:hypothetical protein